MFGRLVHDVTQRNVVPSIDKETVVECIGQTDRNRYIVCAQIIFDVLSFRSLLSHILPINAILGTQQYSGLNTGFNSQSVSDIEVDQYGDIQILQRVFVFVGVSLLSRIVETVTFSTLTGIEQIYRYAECRGEIILGKGSDQQSRFDSYDVRLLDSLRIDVKIRYADSHFRSEREPFLSKSRSHRHPDDPGHQPYSLHNTFHIIDSS